MSTYNPGLPRFHSLRTPDCCGYRFRLKRLWGSPMQYLVIFCTNDSQDDTKASYLHLNRLIGSTIGKNNVDS